MKDLEMFGRCVSKFFLGCYVTAGLAVVGTVVACGVLYRVKRGAKRIRQVEQESTVMVNPEIESHDV